MEARPLVPVLVQLLSGRSGSTLLMQLLATSDEVAFDRMYPFENRYLAYLIHVLTPMGQEFDPDRHLSQSDMMRRPEGLYGPLPFAAALDRRALRDTVFDRAWRGFSDVARQAQPRARYYAEKSFGDYSLVERAGLGHRYVHLLRDPRDVFTSILAFDAQRGFFGFGRKADQSVDAYLDDWIERVRARAAELERTRRAGADVLVLRYETMVADIDATAQQIGSWLGLTLDADAVKAQRAEYRHHMTTEEPSASIGRWRSELPRRHRVRIERSLRTELRAHGY